MGCNDVFCIYCHLSFSRKLLYPLRINIVFCKNYSKRWWFCCFVYIVFFLKSAAFGPAAVSLSHLLSFYLFWAQRLCRSQSDVERLTPELAVTTFGGWGHCRGNPCCSHGGGRVGDCRRDNARLHCRGRGRRMNGSLHLTVITKTDGALQRREVGKPAEQHRSVCGITSIFISDILSG